MNGWIIFFKQRLQLLILSYHLKILFPFYHLFVSSLSFLPPCNQLICLRLVAALSQEEGVGRNMHWHDPVNGLCHPDKAGALEESLCTAASQGVVMMECSWPCSCPAAEPAPGWLQLGSALWVSGGPDDSHELRVRSVALQSLQGSWYVCCLGQKLKKKG